ncbi:MAG: hypothetical protein QF464_07075, partial [Myxococcota bacterium]|nr:hypothetical protein [Myxococcota bacterium]
MNVARSLIVLISLTALVAACSDSSDSGGVNLNIDAGTGIGDGGTATPDTGTGPSGAWEISTVETLVDPSEVIAGGTAEVTCSATDLDGDPIEDLEATVSVSPDDGVTVEGMTITFLSVAVHDVACTVGEVTDDTPAQVNVIAGNPAHVSISLEPDTITADQTSEVTCVITDDQGNTVDATANITVPEGVTVEGNDLIAPAVGSYEITCSTPGAESASATLSVVMGAAVVLELVAEPALERYDVGQGITISGMIVDAHGNKGPTALTALQAKLAGSVACDTLEPAPFPEGCVDSTELYDMAGDDTTHIFLFHADGNYDIYAKVEGNEDLDDDLTVHVDSFGPIITITSPVGAGGEDNTAYNGRGEVVVGEPTVLVEGSVSDTPGGLDPETGLVITINGELAPAGIFEVDKGNFSGEVPLAYGINHITFESSDIWGHTTSWTIAVLWSSDYYALNPPSVETDTIANAMTMHITQDLLDDGEHDHNNLDDLATIAEVILAGTDIAKELGDIALWSTTLEVSLFGIDIPFEIAVTPGTFVLVDPKVSLDLGTGTLTVSLEAWDVVVGLTLEATTDVEVFGGGLSGEGETEGSLTFGYLKMVSTLELGIDPATGELTVAATDNSLEFEELDGEFSDLELSYASTGLATGILIGLGYPATGTL